MRGLENSPQPPIGIKSLLIHPHTSRYAVYNLLALAIAYAELTTLFLALVHGIVLEACALVYLELSSATWAEIFLKVFPT